MHVRYVAGDRRTEFVDFVRIAYRIPIRRSFRGEALDAGSSWLST
jgi:hypothetical protein